MCPLSCLRHLDVTAISTFFLKIICLKFVFLCRKKEIDETVSNMLRNYPQVWLSFRVRVRCLFQGNDICLSDALSREQMEFSLVCSFVPAVSAVIAVIRIVRAFWISRSMFTSTLMFWSWSFHSSSCILSQMYCLQFETLKSCIFYHPYI